MLLLFDNKSSFSRFLLFPFLSYSIYLGLLLLGCLGFSTGIMEDIGLPRPSYTALLKSDLKAAMNSNVILRVKDNVVLIKINEEAY